MAKKEKDTRRKFLVGIAVSLWLDVPVRATTFAEAAEELAKGFDVKTILKSDAAHAVNDSDFSVLNIFEEGVLDQHGLQDV